MSAATDTADCLLEIGLEELPPLAMPALEAALGEGIAKALADRRLAHGAVTTYAAPRRLAVHVAALATRQPDDAEVLRGPPLRVAFDDAGAPTRAALAFAEKAGLSVEALEREETDKGAWLVARVERTGQPFRTLAQEVLDAATEALPIPRRMRWGDHDGSFVRPVHWLVALHGDDVLPVSLHGIAAGRETQGHRFHAPAPFALSAPGNYAAELERRQVIASFERRCAVIASGVDAAATAVGGMVHPDAALVREIAALVDWPVMVTGQFDAQFLALPTEVLASTLKVHQRYFPVLDGNGQPMPFFITVANIDSRNPDAVRDGNQRVITPRLADAAFFWRNDAATRLASRRNALNSVVYQRALGSLGDKTERVAQLVRWIGEATGQESALAERAAQLSRCDLVTDMVGEFPELQGIMGAHYARADGEDDAVAEAIGTFYQPRFAGDAIAPTVAGQWLAVADRVDTLAGIFAIGKRPSGNRDPFGLRRAALGTIRTLIEGGHDLDLPALLGTAMAAQPVDTADHPELAEDLYDFVIERLRHYFMADVCADRPDWFESVRIREPHSLLDFRARLLAVGQFAQLPEAEALAAANKRIANILRGAGNDAHGALDQGALSEPAEQALAEAWAAARSEIAPALEARDYAAVLVRLAGMREPVDRFFDEVMVMAEDTAVRRNRLSLLAAVRAMFLEVADVSELGSSAG